MFTINEYIDSLKQDKTTLVENLTTKGVSASDSETFTTLVPKVLDVPSVDPSAMYNTVISSSDFRYQVKKIVGTFTINLTNLSGLLQNWKGLEEAPTIITTGATSFYNMFQGCTNLISVPLYDSSQVTDFRQMFSGCTNLTTIPKFDTSSGTTFGAMYTNCTHLSDESLDNILQMSIGATSYTGTKSLASCYNMDFRVASSSRFPSLPHYNDFINAGWTIGY